MNNEVTLGLPKRISYFLADRRRAAAGLPPKGIWRMSNQCLSDVVNLTPASEIMARKKAPVTTPFTERFGISLLSMIDRFYAERDFRALLRRTFKVAK